MARKPRKKPRTRKRRPYWLILLLIAGMAFAGWKLWPCFNNQSPQFIYLHITKNQSPLKLINGEGIKLRPSDEMKIEDIATNVCFNRGIRLVAKDLDVEALLYESTPLATLLPDKDVFNRYEFQLKVKHYNQEIGHIDVLIEPTIEDWLDKVDRSIGDKRKVAVLERALKFAPKDQEIKNRLIKGYKSLKQWKKAAQLLEKEAKQNPNPEVLYELLEVYEAMSSSSKTISVLKRLSKIAPNNPDVAYRLAMRLEKKGRITDAIREYEKLLKLVNKADRLSIYKTLGFLYANQNNTKKAIDNYLKAVELDKNDVNLYHNLSFLYEKIGQKDKADYYLAQAVNRQTGDVDSRLRLAERLVEKREWGEAEKHLQEILKNQPKSIKALFLLLRIAEKRDDKVAARKYYREILAVDPQNMDITYNLGVMEYEAGNMDKALDYFKDFAKSKPEDTNVHAFMFDIYMKQGQKDHAYKEARIMIGLNPSEIDYYRYIYSYLSGRDYFEEMVVTMQEGLKSNPKNTELREYLVQGLLKLGKDDQAVAQMKEILKYKPDDVPLLLQTARLEEKLGRRKEALASYEKVIELSPGHEEAEEAYLRLRLKVLPFEE